MEGLLKDVPGLLAQAQEESTPLLPRCHIVKKIVRVSWVAIHMSRNVSSDLSNLHTARMCFENVST